MRYRMQVDFWFIIFSICVAFFCSYWFKRCGCYLKWSRSGLESEYGFFDNCTIKVNDHWIPEDKYFETKR